MGTIKDRNGMDLTEVEEINKSGKNTQKNCTKKIYRNVNIKTDNVRRCSVSSTAFLYSS